MRIVELLKFSLLCTVTATVTALSQASIIAQYPKENMIEFSQQPCWMDAKIQISETSYIVNWFHETELQAIYLYQSYDWFVLDFRLSLSLPWNMLFPWDTLSDVISGKSMDDWDFALLSSLNILCPLFIRLLKAF